ncbi:MAG TPA: CdaR family protein, partial [Bacteroidales bacterium]|nr:CdaR family protein [Bacteroidales bacterium]
FLSGSKNLTLNIGQAEIKRSRYFDRYYLLTSNLYNLISGKFDFGHSLVSVSPDTLFLDFEEVMSKKLPVKLDLTYTCKPQYQVYDSIRVIPDSINISGPSSMLDSIQSISSVATVLKDLDRNIESAVALKLPLKDERISYSANQVNVIIPVEKYTESTIEIPIAGLTTEAESTIRTFPEMVQITYQVAIKDFNLVRNDMFLATAAFDPVRDKGKNFIKVSIDRSPEFVRIVRVQPDKVEFLLQK